MGINQRKIDYMGICNNPSCLAHSCSRDGPVLMTSNHAGPDIFRLFCSWKCLIAFAENPHACAMRMRKYVMQARNKRLRKHCVFSDDTLTYVGQRELQRNELDEAPEDDGIPPERRKEYERYRDVR